MTQLSKIKILAEDTAKTIWKYELPYVNFLFFKYLSTCISNRHFFCKFDIIKIIANIIFIKKDVIGYIFIFITNPNKGIRRNKII